MDEFESTMMTLKMNHCNCCQQVKIGMPVNSSGRCNKCARSGMTAEKWIDEFMLPVWFDEKGDPHYELPSKLCDLEIGEKILIQQLAPFVPLRHIWRDHVGIKGHVCSFPQRIDEVVHELPRLPERKSQCCENGEIIQKRTQWGSENQDIPHQKEGGFECSKVVGGAQ